MAIFIKNILTLFIFILGVYPFLTMANLRSQELRVTLQASLISLDPGGVQDSQSWVVSRQVNCQLVRNQGSIFILEAADSIKYISPLKILLKISDKARFHDGSSVTAEDVFASFDYIKESRNILGNLFTWIEKIELVDNKTLLFTLKRQVPQFLKVLSSTNYAIFKKTFLEKAKKDKSLWKKPLGCGGYKVTEFDDNHIKLMPISRGMLITFYLSKTNQVDIKDLENYDIVTTSVIGNSKELSNFNIIEMFDPTQFFIGLNSKSKFWKNKEDRCKFLSEINVNNLLSSYGKPIIEASYFLPKETLGFNSKENFNRKIDKIAKNTNDKISSLNSFCLSYLTVSIQEKHKNEYLNMVKKIYPNTYLQPIADVKQFGKDFVKKNCDAILFAWKSNYLDGYEYLTMFEGNANFSGINDKNISRRILLSQELSTAAKRANEYQSIINEIGNFCIVKPLFTLPTKKIYVRKNIKTPGIGLISIHQYYLGNIIRL